MNKNAYITLLTTKDYLEAVLVLNKSLKKVKAKYPLVVACTPNIYNNEIIKNILNTEKIIIEKISWYEYTPKTKEKLSIYNLFSVYNIGSKLEIFSLKQYNKLVYIDADAFVVKNIDHLFRKRDGSTLYEKQKDEVKCFCALFVFIPHNHPASFYKTLMSNEHINDGTLMEEFWWHIKDNKNYLINKKYFYTPFDEKKHWWVKAYHLQTPQLKYWKTKSNTQLARNYYKILNPLQEKYKEELYFLRLENKI